LPGFFRSAEIKKALAFGGVGGQSGAGRRPLVEAYENKRYDFGTADPVEAIKFRMEQGGRTPRDLEPFIEEFSYSPMLKTAKLYMPRSQSLEHQSKA
jgi:hypothetical protein